MNKSKKEVKIAEKLQKHFGWTDWMLGKVMEDKVAFNVANKIMEWELEEEERLRLAYMRREKK